MTPLEYADHLRKDFEEYAVACGVAIPKVSYSKTGDMVISCESLIAAASSVDATPLFDEQGGKCGYIQVGTFIIALSRDCAYEMEDDGTENVEEVKRISAQTDKDADCLWSWVLSIDPYWAKDFSIGFANTGGLAISSLQLTIGVP